MSMCKYIKIAIGGAMAGNYKKRSLKVIKKNISNGRHTLVLNKMVLWE
jgi:hypothetical protein